MNDEERIWIISHHLCGLSGACNCEGDGYGADTDKAACWNMARGLVAGRLKPGDRAELMAALGEPRL